MENYSMCPRQRGKHLQTGGSQHMLQKYGMVCPDILEI